MMTVIRLHDPAWHDCAMCGDEKYCDHAVGWYEGAVQEDIGTILPHGGEVGGMSVCKDCHDKLYQRVSSIQECKT